MFLDDVFDQIKQLKQEIIFSSKLLQNALGSGDKL